FNYRMTDIQAAVGREQLKRLIGIVGRRRAMAARYATLLRSVDGVEAPREPEWARSNWQSYPVRLADGCDQRAVMQFMLDRGISTKRGIMCAHRQAAYADQPSVVRHTGLARSEEAEDRVILLPLYDQLLADDQEAIVNALQEALCV